MAPLLAMAAASMGRLSGAPLEREIRFPDYMMKKAGRRVGPGGQKFQDRSKYSGADIRRLYAERGIRGPRPPHTD